MRNLLDILQSVFIIIFCALGSAAFLRDLLREVRRASCTQRIKRVRPQLPDVDEAFLVEPKGNPRRKHNNYIGPVQDAPAQADQHQTDKAESVAETEFRYPQEPPGDLPVQLYEVANPGYKLSQGFGIQLQQTPGGVLQACKINGVTCVYVQPGLEDAGVDLKRQGIPLCYEICGPDGTPYRKLPQGNLRLRNIQPAICLDYGHNLTLQTKGRLYAVPTD